MLERLSIRAVLRRRPANFFVGGFYRVMEADESASAFHLSIEFSEMGDRRVVGAAIGVDENGVGVVYQVLGRPLAVEAYLHVYFVRSTFPQAFCQQLDSGVVLMLAGAVARAPSDEEDVAFSVGSVGGSGEEDQRTERQLG